MDCINKFLITMSLRHQFSKETGLLVLFLIVAVMSGGKNLLVTNDPNCHQYNSDATCKCCSFHFYKNIATGYCTPVSDQCNTWCNETGVCTSCFPGNGIPIDGVCYPFGICNKTTGGDNENCTDPVETNPNDTCSEYQYVDTKGKFFKKFSRGCKKVCVKCIDGYYLDDSHNCVELPTGCLAVDCSTGLCTLCEDGYELNQTTGYCDVSLDPCKQYKYFDKKGREGRSNAPGCKKVCVCCIEGYYLNSDNQCIQLPTGCVSVNEEGECTQCEDGYVLNETSYECYVDQPVEICVRYAYKNDKRNNKQKGKWSSQKNRGEKCQQVCIQCIDGYYLNCDNECIILPENCLVVDKKGECTCCQVGYNIDQTTGYCVEIVAIDPCAHYKYIDKKGKQTKQSSSGCQKVCTACIDGYYLNKKNICIALPTGCLAVDCNGTCTSCASGYTLNSSTHVCDVITGDNCAVYGFHKNGRWSSKWDTKCEKICILCDPGFYLGCNNTCVELPGNCISVDEQGECTACEVGYLLNCTTGQCDVDTTDPCKQYKYNDRKGKSIKKYSRGCQKICVCCIEGFYLNCDNQCIRLPTGCAEVNQNGQCTSCLDGYTLNETTYVCELNGHCLKFGYKDNLGRWFNKKQKKCQQVCLQCQVGFYLDKQHICQSIPENCIVVDLKSGNCVKCADGYGANTTTGECDPNVGGPIDTCAQYGYANENKKWIGKWQKNCNKVCIKCIYGYYLDESNVCQLLSDNCRAAEPNGNCIYCIQGYVVNCKTGLCEMDICQPNDTCVSYSYVNKKGKSDKKWFTGYQKVCTCCIEGYYLDQTNSCVQLPPGCLKADPCGDCKKCDDGYVLNTTTKQCDVAIVETDNCARYSNKNKNDKWIGRWAYGCQRVCIKCKPGFYLKKNHTCVALPPNCAAVDCNGNCITCVCGYTLNQTTGNCVSTTGLCDFSLCSKVNSDGSCSCCVYRAYVNDKGCCVNVNGNCSKWKQDGTCTCCYLGYVINPKNHKECILAN